MTLIELTVVILVLLSLIAVLFIGGRSWKRGSDRSLSIITIRNTQMGLRSHVQISDVRETSQVDLPDAIFGSSRFVANGIDSQTGLPKAIGELPDHPVEGLDYDFVAGDGDIIPPLGTLYICTGGASGLNDFRYNPEPSVYGQW